jgi:hypothetical protein
MDENFSLSEISSSGTSVSNSSITTEELSELVLEGMTTTLSRKV